MATFGVTSVTYSAFEFTGLNTLNQEALLASLGVIGRISSITVQMGGHTAAVNTKLCLWDGAGNLVGSSATFSAAKGTGAVGGQTTYTQPLSSSYLALVGSYYIGWYRDPALDAEWSYAASGTLYQKTNTGASPASMSGASTVAHQILGYATYTPVQVKIRRSGAWVTVNPSNIRRSGAWQLLTDEIRRSGGWTPLSRGWLRNRRSGIIVPVWLEEGEPQQLRAA